MVTHNFNSKLFIMETPNLKFDNMAFITKSCFHRFSLTVLSRCFN